MCTCLFHLSTWNLRTYNDVRFCRLYPNNFVYNVHGLDQGLTQIENVCSQQTELTHQYNNAFAVSTEF